jgi:hypothetical protein
MIEAYLVLWIVLVHMRDGMLQVTMRMVTVTMRYFLRSESVVLTTLQPDRKLKFENNCNVVKL